MCVVLCDYVVNLMLLCCFKYMFLYVKKLFCLCGGGVFLYKFSKIYLFERDFHLLFHPPNVHSSQCWVRLNPEAWNSVQVSHVGCRDPSVFEPSTETFQCETDVQAIP